MIRIKAILFQEEWNLPGSITEIADHEINMESPEKSESATSQTQVDNIEEILGSDEMTEPPVCSNIIHISLPIFLLCYVF